MTGPNGRTAVADRLLEQVDLRDAADRKVTGYSGGMEKRLGVAQAIAGESTTVEFRTEFEPERVVVDPDVETLMLARESPPLASTRILPAPGGERVREGSTRSGMITAKVVVVRNERCSRS